MKLTAILVLALFSSQAFSFSEAGVEPTLQFNMKVLKSVSMKRSSQTLDVKIEDLSFPSKTRLDKKQKEQFLKALKMLKPVLNSTEFKQKVLSYVRPGHTEPGFQKNYLWRNKEQKLSSSDIYNIIMTADEKMVPNTKNEMNLNGWVKKCKWPQTWGVWCRKVIGSTSPSSSKVIKFNWKFYKNFDAPKMVNNIVHEWLHLLGFLHGKKDMREEVPYVVGKIAEEVARNMFKK